VTTWIVELRPAAQNVLRKADKQVKARIVAALERLAQTEDPSQTCKALKGPLIGLWRYRVGDWRAICDIQRGRVVIEVILIGHRKDIYD